MCHPFHFPLVLAQQRYQLHQRQVLHVVLLGRRFVAQEGKLMCERIDHFYWPQQPLRVLV